MALRYAYNTNGCAHHRLPEALDLIAEAGYDGVALTLDWQHLDPLAENWEQRTRAVADLLTERQLGCVIETGARYLLDHRHKHEPTLINPTADGRRTRVDFLKRAVDIAAMLKAETVSFWAGVRQEAVDREAAHAYLIEGLHEVCDHADRRGVVPSFEPEPGMLLETNADYLNLLEQAPSLSDRLRLALDLGHMWVTGEGDPARAIEEHADRLGTVSIEGMDRGIHLHLPLDRGDMSIPPLLAALEKIEFPGLVCVELSRESPRAHLAIPESIQHLRSAAQNT